MVGQNPDPVEYYLRTGALISLLCFRGRFAYLPSFLFLRLMIFVGEEHTKMPRR